MNKFFKPLVASCLIYGFSGASLGAQISFGVQKVETYAYFGVAGYQVTTDGTGTNACNGVTGNITLLIHDGLFLNYDYSNAPGGPYDPTNADHSRSMEKRVDNIINMFMTAAANPQLEIVIDNWGEALPCNYQLDTRDDAVHLRRKN